MTKTEQKMMWMKELGIGQRMITSAEFRLGFKDISREQFDVDVLTGNKIIANVMDIADATGLRLRF